MEKRELRQYVSEPWRKARVLARLLDAGSRLSVGRVELRERLASDPHISPRLLTQAEWWLKGKRAERE